MALAQFNQTLGKLLINTWGSRVINFAVPEFRGRLMEGDATLAKLPSPGYLGMKNPKYATDRFALWRETSPWQSRPHPSYLALKNSKYATDRISRSPYGGRCRFGKVALTRAIRDEESKYATDR
ncbi:hypothetical protein CEXT_708051 [Caerostris extrusa]|uniref:Uncharacterized protein n=1 Tax=Caerostris extrusa TaxID=172846 RepID=A0AAV4RMX7_CAEEX|nr:hypothetical protein CEXT_708051 [Caerostris extrusa]